MKRKVYIRYKTRKKGGQRYWVGRKPRNFSSPILRIAKPTRGMKLRDAKEDIELNLTLIDISPGRRKELESQLGNVNKSLKNPLFAKDFGSFGRKNMPRLVTKYSKQGDVDDMINKFEIKQVSRVPGRKTKLLQLREDLEENLTVPDISSERKQELLDRLDNINQRVKRTQGNPPYLPATGRVSSEMKLSLLERYKGTSTKRPEFVEELNLPLQANLPLLRAEQQRRATEQYGVKKALDIIETKALKEATERQRQTGTKLSLEDLKKYKRVFGSFPPNRTYVT